MDDTLFTVVIVFSATTGLVVNLYPVPPSSNVNVTLPVDCSTESILAFPCFPRLLDITSTTSPTTNSLPVSFIVILVNEPTTLGQLTRLPSTVKISSKVKDPFTLERYKISKYWPLITFLPNPSTNAVAPDVDPTTVLPTNNFVFSDKFTSR